MTVIAPTGSSREEDFKLWYQAIGGAIKDENRYIVLIYEHGTDNIIGFFQYSIDTDSFMMEELQICSEFQGKDNIFRDLFGFVLKNISPELLYVEAYANKANHKSIGILGKLGLKVIGENKNGKSFHFKGDFADLMSWHVKGGTSLKDSIDVMVKSMHSILKDNLACIYLYGSVAMDDFKLGWSDIDIVCLTRATITDSEAKKLVGLRQQLLDEEKENQYYRSFEGIITTIDEFVNNEYTKVVYWGTSGQKIIDNYYFDECSLFELIKYGKLIYGEDIRGKMAVPTYEELKGNVQRHYETIRKYVQKTNENIYSCGWMLDIARCIYTLRYNDVISKTKAGEWALEENICPEKKQMIQTLKVRKAPLKFKEQSDVKQWFGQLGPSVQKFADVLEIELNR